MAGFGAKPKGKKMDENEKAAIDKLLSVQAYAARLAMDRVQDADANIYTRLLAAAVLNGVDRRVVYAIAASKEGWTL